MLYVSCLWGWGSGVGGGVLALFECFIVCKSIDWVGWDRVGPNGEGKGEGWEAALFDMRRGVEVVCCTSKRQKGDGGGG